MGERARQTVHDTDDTVLGVDVGGSKAVCRLSDGAGRTIAEQRGPGASLHALDAGALDALLRGVLDPVLARAGRRPAVVCLGIAGAGPGGRVEVVESVLRRIVPCARIIVTSDAIIALEAAITEGPGVLIAVGTGSIVLGRDGRQRAARAGGWGHLLADEGSAYWFGLEALRASVRAGDGRGPATRLADRVRDRLRVADTPALVARIYDRDVRPSTLAALASCVQAAYDEGDEVAAALLDAGSAELVRAADTVVSRLGLGGVPFPFVLAGGAFLALPALATALERRLPAVAGRARVERLGEDPVTGAVRLALKARTAPLQIPVLPDR